MPLQYSGTESEAKHSAVMLQIVKLNDFTVECKMIIVVFLARLVLAVGNKPTLTCKCTVNAAVLAGLQQVQRATCTSVHPSCCCPVLTALLPASSAGARGIWLGDRSTPPGASLLGVFSVGRLT